MRTPSTKVRLHRLLELRRVQVRAHAGSIGSGLLRITSEMFVVQGIRTRALVSENGVVHRPECLLPGLRPHAHRGLGRMLHVWMNLRQRGVAKPEIEPVVERCFSRLTIG